MSDIVAFLRARLDEDEAAIHTAVPDPDELDGGLYLIGVGSTLPLVMPVPRARREVEAKRRIMAYYDECEFCEKSAVGVVLFMLALSYADHLDYDPEWRLQAASTS